MGGSGTLWLQDASGAAVPYLINGSGSTDTTATGALDVTIQFDTASASNYIDNRYAASRVTYFDPN